MTDTTNPFRNPHRPAAGARLCAAAEVAEGEIRRFVYGASEPRFRAFLIRTHAGLHGFMDWCGHLGLPLQDDRDPIMRSDGLIMCAWHMARFNPDTGAPVDGPCVGGLPSWPIEIDEYGVVWTA